MQQLEHAATKKQQGYIRALHRKGLIEELPEFSDLSAGEASLLITRALDTAQRAENGGSEVSRQELDPIRLGLCIKLVFNKHEHNVQSPVGTQNFKKEVKELYKIIAGLESEMAA